MSAARATAPPRRSAGLLGNDRRPPGEFYATGREEIAAYDSVELRDVEAVDGERRDDGFALELADGDGQVKGIE
jgi:hypothetical protein